ncbi:MAG: YgjV family protein [Spirochaetales bacterium]|nr:YgjV family protein [Spirochaetales bacterium]
MLEIFGYLGSFVVLISLTMNSIVKLRWINLIGATMFTIYSLFIGAYPAVVMNFGIIIIDTYYIVKLNRDGKRTPEAIN